MKLSDSDIKRLSSKQGLIEILSASDKDIEKALKHLKYKEELEKLQVELVKLQNWIKETNLKTAIIFEGRDAAGKGGAIARFSEHLSPRGYRTVALPKPSDIEKEQWYFRRYVQHLPNPGELVFFDRSWYNRAIVEPVMGFCTEEQYTRFMGQVNSFEKMLIDDGLHMLKLWFSVSKEEQSKRFKERETNPLKQWKLSPVDKLAQDKWEDYTFYKDEMLRQTNSAHSPWVVVQANDRLESIRYLLSKVEYTNKSKDKSLFAWDEEVIQPLR